MLWTDGIFIDIWAPKWSSYRFVSDCNFPTRPLIRIVFLSEISHSSQRFNLLVLKCILHLERSFDSLQLVKVLWRQLFLFCEVIPADADGVDLTLFKLPWNSLFDLDVGQFFFSIKTFVVLLVGIASYVWMRLLASLLIYEYQRFLFSRFSSLLNALSLRAGHSIVVGILWSTWHINFFTRLFCPMSRA